MLRREEEAEEYRRSLGRFSEEEGFKVMPAEDEVVRHLLKIHECTQVVTPVSWIGVEEPDFFTVEDFMKLLESVVSA